MNGVAVQEGRIFDHSRAGYHDIAHAEVDLDFQAHVVHACIHQDAHSLVLGIFCDFLGYYAVGEERETVRLYFESRTVLDEGHQARLIGLALAQHVDVHGGTRPGHAYRFQ